ncbi:MAG TPA: FAD-dependent oxidoreductase [Candidatus Omnitrophota bacterium]|nr:FAD-dependent oxidoreductase [Candidatus Omnitrophota bacterium]
MTKIGILGGGLAGLSLAYFLEKKGFATEVLETETVCGGLCRSFNKDGFTYDLGGHIVFSKDESTLSLMVKMLGSNKKKLYRNNKVWFKRRFVKYPFENGLSALDKEDIADCLLGFIDNRHAGKPHNFREWLYHTFGDGLADKYLIPYNEKIWNCPTNKMGLEWVERVPKPPVADIVRSALGIETEGYTHQLYFYYPKRGGIQALTDAFRSKLSSVMTGFGVRSVRKAGRKWIVSDGNNDREYDRIVSCLPLVDLVPMLDGVPSSIRSEARGLKYNSLSVVMLGIDRKNLTDKFAVYFPQQEFPFHRVCFHSYMGESYAPRGMSMAVAEITTNPGDGVHELSDRQLVEKVSSGLAREGFIRKGEVCASDVKRMKYAYVVTDLKYSKRLKRLRLYFRSIGLLLCGRFAEHEYLNMDAVIGRARRLAGEIG